jgi:hypothetical protein
VARVEGFEPAQIGQEPIDFNGDPVAVGAWGDSRTGVGVFGASGALPPDVDDIPTNIAGVEGHSIQIPGVFGLSVEDAGVRGGSLQGLGVLGRSSTGTRVPGVTFAPSTPGGAAECRWRLQLQQRRPQRRDRLRRRRHRLLRGALPSMIPEQLQSQIQPLGRPLDHLGHAGCGEARVPYAGSLF